MEEEDLTTLDMLRLLDLLAKYTRESVGLLKLGLTGEDYYYAKSMIEQLLAEITRRKNNEVIENEIKV